MTLHLVTAFGVKTNQLLSLRGRSTNIILHLEKKGGGGGGEGVLPSIWKVQERGGGGEVLQLCNIIYTFAILLWERLQVNLKQIK